MALGCTCSKGTCLVMDLAFFLINQGVGLLWDGIQKGDTLPVVLNLLLLKLGYNGVKLGLVGLILLKF
jgi:hypothetical protein